MKTVKITYLTFKFIFHQGEGRKWLEAFYEEQGVEKQEIHAKVLFHN